MQLISVVLASGWGDQGRARKWVDTKAVLNYGFDNFSYENIIKEDTSAGVVPVTRSRKSEIEYVYRADLTLPLHKEEKGLVEVRLTIPPYIQAPIARGQVVGQASVFIKDRLCAVIDVTVTEEALRHDYKTSLEKVVNQWLSQVIDEPVQLILPEFSLHSSIYFLGL